MNLKLLNHNYDNDFQVWSLKWKFLKPWSADKIENDHSKVSSSYSQNFDYFDNLKVGKITTPAAFTQTAGESSQKAKETSTAKPQNEFTDFPFISQANDISKIEFQAAKQANETIPSTISMGESNVRFGFLSILIMFYFVFY